MLRTVNATRYVTPFREGGSLPALVEADDLGLYVLKFRGAGQGPLALVAEIVAGHAERIARTSRVEEKIGVGGSQIRVPRIEQQCLAEMTLGVGGAA